MENLQIIFWIYVVLITITLVSATVTPSSATVVQVTGCNASLSFTSGPYEYHVVSTCEGTYTLAMSGCEALGGTLAIPRNREVIQTISDFVYEPVIVTARQPSHETLTHSYWTGSYFAFPDLDPGASSGGTCGILEFLDNPLSDAPQVEWRLTNECDSQDAIYPWICETFTASYTPDVPDIVSKQKAGTVMDYRASAMALGASGMFIMLTVYVAIMGLDLVRLKNALKLWRKMNRRHTKTHPIASNDKNEQTVSA